MDEKLLLNRLSRRSLSNIIECCILIYVFTQPFIRHTATIQATTIVAALTFWLVKILYFRGYKFNKTVVTTFFLVYISIVIVSVLFGTEMSLSLKALKSNILKQLILYLIILNEVKTITQVKRFLYVMVLSITCLLIGSLIQYGFWHEGYAGLHEYVYKITNKGTFIVGYGPLSTFYYPITLTLVILEKARRRQLAIMASAVLQFGFLYLYGHNTGLVCAVAVTVALPLLLRKYKYVVVCGIILLVAGASITVFFPKGRFQLTYKEIFNKSSYEGPDAISARLPTWRAAYEMWKERPILGFGYGWKKFIGEGRKRGYTKLLDSPHNLVLSILFESGIMGLISLLLFWASVAVSFVRNYLSAVTDEYKLFLVGIFGLLISYSIVNTTMSMWYGVHGKMMIVVVAMGLCTSLDKLRADNSPKV